MRTTLENELHKIGKQFLIYCEYLGSFILFFSRAMRQINRKSFSLKRLLLACNKVGFESLSIIILTGTCTGMVFALQTYIGFQRIGGDRFIGLVVALGIIRELGPVLTGIMVTGRAGSAIAAEIGTMRITEQIDALQTIGINPLQFLVVPYLIAGIIMLPCLTIFAMISGLIGGYISTVYMLGLSADDYINSIVTTITMYDIVGGLTKAAIFGLIIAWVSSYKGFYTKDGAHGVGIATTQTVVTSSVLILLFDYLLTKLLELS